jgi:hypothetical protein
VGNVERLRILVGNMPRLLRDIVEEIVRSQPDMDIIDQYQGELIIERHQVDVVVSGEHADNKLKISIVGNNGGGSNLVESLQLSTVELSPEILVKAIRGAAVKTR